MTDDPVRFKDTTLSVLTDVAAEIVAKGQTPILTDEDAARLYRITRAAMDLGAAPLEVADALKEGFERK